MTVRPKSRPAFVPPDIWAQCHETMCVCYKHRWWGLACWCPECRPATKPAPMRHLPDDPYAPGSAVPTGPLAPCPDPFLPGAAREGNRLYLADDCNCVLRAGAVVEPCEAHARMEARAS